MVHPYIFIRRSRIPHAGTAFLFVSGLLLFLLLAVGPDIRKHYLSTGIDNPWKQNEVLGSSAIAEWHWANRDIPYLIVDFRHSELLIKLRGAVLWNGPFAIDPADTGKARSFLAYCLDRGDGDKLHVAYVHIFAGRTMFSDSTLEIIGEALDIAPKSLQRITPGHFSICLGDGVYLHIVTGADSSSFSHIANGLEFARETTARALGGTALTLHTDPRAAQAVFGACAPGMPVLIRR